MIVSLAGSDIIEKRANAAKWRYQEQNAGLGPAVLEVDSCSVLFSGLSPGPVIFVL